MYIYICIYMYICIYTYICHERASLTASTTSTTTVGEKPQQAFVYCLCTVVSRHSGGLVNTV